LDEGQTMKWIALFLILWFAAYVVLEDD